MGADAGDAWSVDALLYAHRTGQRGGLLVGHDERSAEPQPVAYWTWLLRRPGHAVLVDAGMTPQRAARLPGLTYVATPAETLAGLGVGPGDLDLVVLTHLHADHAGTLPDLPGVRVVVQRAELDYWGGPDAARVTRERWLTDDADVATVRAAADEGRADLLDGDADLLPGLSVHLVGGHTAGLQVVRVRTARGHLVLASDAVHLRENLATDRPFPYSHTTLDCYRAFDRCRDLADGDDLVVPGHEPPTGDDRRPVVRLA